MCEKCASAVRQFYPHLTEQERGELLYGATAFPFGNHETVERQLRELCDQTDGSLEQALAYADAVTEAAMLRYSADRMGREKQWVRR